MWHTTIVADNLSYLSKWRPFWRPPIWLPPWASEGGTGGALDPTLDFEIISKKRLFFQFRGVKNKFHHFWPSPVNKNWENPYWPPLKKILPTPMTALPNAWFGSATDGYKYKLSSTCKTCMSERSQRWNFPFQLWFLGCSCLTYTLSAVAADLVSRNINTEFQRESENPDCHDSNHITARTGGDLAALRHWLTTTIRLQPTFWTRKCCITFSHAKMVTRH